MDGMMQKHLFILGFISCTYSVLNRLITLGESVSYCHKGTKKTITKNLTDVQTETFFGSQSGGQLQDDAPGWPRWDNLASLHVFVILLQGPMGQPGHTLFIFTAE